MCSPEGVVLSNCFIRGKRRFPISGAHIGAPLRRRGSVAPLFIYMVNRSSLFCAEMFPRAKAFSSGEGFRIVKRFSHCKIFHQIATSAAAIGQPQGLSLRSTYDLRTHPYKSGASANQCVRPRALSCQTVFTKETMLSYPGAHIGAPLRRRGRVALLFTIRS